MSKTTAAVPRCLTQPDAKPALRNPVFITVDEIKPGSCAHSTLSFSGDFEPHRGNLPNLASIKLSQPYLYLHPDKELQDYSIQVMDMLQLDTSVNAQALIRQNDHLAINKLVTSLTRGTLRLPLVQFLYKSESRQIIPKLLTARFTTI